MYSVYRLSFMSLNYHQVLAFEALSFLPALRQRPREAEKRDPGEDSDDVIFHFYGCLCKRSIALYRKEQMRKRLEDNKLTFSC